MKGKLKSDGFTVQELITELQRYPMDKKVKIFTTPQAVGIKIVIEGKKEIILSD